MYLNRGPSQCPVFFLFLMMTLGLTFLTLYFVPAILEIFQKPVLSHIFTQLPLLSQCTHCGAATSFLSSYGFATILTGCWIGVRRTQCVY
ncbi:hypothetical protein F5146DRAFT_1049723 [Armillaria mellea]|nr:hypothetical protein F5146DRAFT_1049723 [Armillaria mellea]